jgi:DNA-binding CsgD family transcriptional regulator/predicted ATPase
MTTDLASPEGGASPIVPVQEPPVRLIGRGDELESLARALEPRRSSPVINVTGARGTGKSALVRAALQSAAARSADVRRLELSGESAETALAELRRHLARLPPSHHRGDLHLTDRRTLVHLDRADVVAAVAGDLGRLVAGHPGTTLVVESVPQLRAPGITVVEVGPLDAPSAEELFRRTAESMGVALGSDETTAADIERVCGAVDGNPLAVELAAARLTSLPLRSLASLLDRPGRALAVLSRPATVSSEGRAIRTDLADSHRSTSAPAQRLLDLLSVFAGSFTLEAVEAVTAGHVSPCFDPLGELLDLRLVELDTEATEQRYRLRRLVRDYASERLAESGLEDEARDRHATHYCDVARTAALAAEEADEDRARTLIGEDYAEAFAALRWLREHDAVRALRLAADLGWEAERRGTGAALLEHLEDLTAGEPGGAEAARRDALLWLVQLSSWSSLGGDRAGVIRGQLDEALDLARRVGEPLPLLRALRTRFLAVAAHGDLAAAMDACREGTRLADAIGHPRWLGRFEVSLGAMHGVLRQYGTAAELGTSGLARAVRAGDRRGIALASLLLHGLPPEHVDDPAGLPSLEAVLQIFRAHGDLQNELHTLATLAHEAIDRGDHLAAARWVLARRERLGRTDLVNGLTVSVMLAVHISRLRGDHAVSALLHGSVASHMEPLMALLAPRHVELYRSGLRTLRAELGAGRFESEVARGRMLDREETLVELVGYLRAVVDGPQPSAARPQPAGAEGADGAALPGLTPRETQVLRLLGRGLRNKEIASELGITAKSVMHHTVSIYRRLGVRSRTEAVALAARRGLIPD